MGLIERNRRKICQRFLMGMGNLAAADSDSRIVPVSASRTEQLPWLSIVVIVASFLLRAAVAGRVGVLPEEAYYWNYAQRPSLGYFDHPPAVAWMIGASTNGLGHTDLALRLGPMVCAVVVSVFLFLLTAARWQDRTAAWRAVALFNVIPVFLGTGFFAFPDAPLMAAWAAAIYFGYRAVQTGGTGYWLAWGVAAGGALLSKYYGGALLLAAGLFAVTTPEGRTALKRPGIYLGVLMALVLFTPVIWWNAQHDWVSFRFQFLRRSVGGAHFNLPQSLVMQMGAVTPVVLVICVLAGWMAVRRADWRDRWLAWQFWPMFSAFTLYSFKNEVHVNWISPAYLSLLPLVQAYLVRRPAPSLKFAGWSRALRWSVAIGAVAACWLVGYLGGIVPRAWVPRSISRSLDAKFSWKEFSAAVERVEHEVQRERGEEPFYLGADKYYLASVVAYLDDDRDWWDAASRNLLDKDALAWGMWSQPRSFNGRDALILAENPERLSEDDLRPFFKDLGPVQPLPLQGLRPTDRRFYYRVGYRYQHS
jgi:dolichol-phosphate mannosyltransferase